MTRVKLCFTLLITIIFAAAALWGNPNVTEAATSPLRITVISKNQLRLVWEDNLDNELGFRIERKIGNGSFTMRAITGSNVTTFLDNEVIEEAEYTYRVMVKNDKGEWEPYTNEVAVSTASVSRPSSMRLVVLSESEIEISWQYSGLRGYATCIERRKGGTGNWEQVAIVPDGIIDYLDSGLESDTLYYYRIRATAGPDVYSEYYPSANGQGKYTPVSGPTDLYGFADSSHEIILTWTDAPNESYYVIERKTEDGKYSVVGLAGKDSTTWHDRNTIKGTVYSYRVKAVRSARESLYSNEITITCWYVATPAGLHAEFAEGNTVKLTWIDNENLEGEYEIYRKSDKNGDWSLVAVLPVYARSYTDVGLTGSTKYYYMIRVVVDYRGVQSAYSNQVSVTTAGLEAPYNFRYMVQDGNRIRLLWSYKSAANTGGFRIERKEGDGNWIDIGGVSANTRSYYDLVEEYKVYYYRVKVYDNSKKTVSYSEPIMVSAGKPARPENLEVTGISCREVELVWTDSASNEEKYVIERQLMAGSFIEIAALPPGTTRYIDRNAIPGMAYAYRVRAVNKSGSGISATKYIRVERAVSFDDIPEGHPFLKTAEILASRGISGSKGYFMPNKLITRAEFTAWAVRSLGLADIPVGSFNDVKYGDAFYTEIMSAKKLGITDGAPGGYFRPDDPITREDMAVIIFRAIDAAGVNIRWYDDSVLAKYADSSEVSDYSLLAVASVVEEGILKVSADGKLQPKANATRMEAAEIIMNVLYYCGR
jgi:hypothetical protein